MLFLGVVVTLLGLLLSNVAGALWGRYPLLHLVPILYGLASYAAGNALFFHRPWEALNLAAMPAILYGFAWIAHFYWKRNL